MTRVVAVRAVLAFVIAFLVVALLTGCGGYGGGYYDPAPVYVHVHHTVVHHVIVHHYVYHRVGRR